MAQTVKPEKWDLEEIWVHIVSEGEVVAGTFFKKERALHLTAFVKVISLASYHRAFYYIVGATRVLDLSGQVKRVWENPVQDLGQTRCELLINTGDYPKEITVFYGAKAKRYQLHTDRVVVLSDNPD